MQFMYLCIHNMCLSTITYSTIIHTYDASILLNCEIMGPLHSVVYQ